LHCLKLWDCRINILMLSVVRSMSAVAKKLGDMEE